MEAEVRKLQQKFKRVREEMGRWGELQVRLVSQFRNASAIMDRLQVIRDGKNYGALKSVGGIGEAVWTKQMESLETTLLSMRKTMEEFQGVVTSLEKIHRDGKQLLKGGSGQPSVKHLQQRVGVKPCLQDCLDGLMILNEMHRSEYATYLSGKTTLLVADALFVEWRDLILGEILEVFNEQSSHRYFLKSSVISALSTLVLKPSASDLHELQQLLVDQPNIPIEEVQFIYDIIFAEEIC